MCFGHTQSPCVSAAVDWTKHLTAQSADWISTTIRKEKLEVLHPFAVDKCTNVPTASVSFQTDFRNTSEGPEVSRIPLWSLTWHSSSSSHQDTGAGVNYASLADWLKPHFPQALLRLIIHIPVCSPFQRGSDLTLTTRFNLNLNSI